ncbi:hypothetical protein QL285_037984 [Trifolium repens]|nr:hypothetical protein QL285_037984 [Trifolium repens]
MGSSTNDNDNDKPVLAVKEDPPMFAKHFRDYLLPRFIYSDEMISVKQNITELETLPALSSDAKTTSPVIMKMSSTRDELLSALDKFASFVPFIRHKSIHEKVEDGRKVGNFGLVYRSYIMDHSFSNSVHPPFINPCYSKTGVVEELRRSYENIKNKHFVCAGKKTEVQFWLNIEAILSHYRYAGGLHSTNLSGVWRDFQCGFEDCPPNHFTALLVNKEKQRSIIGNMSSMQDNNELYWSNNIYEYNQHIIRKEIVRRSSSFLVSTIVVLGIFYNICSSQLSIINFPTLHKERNVSIWLSLLGLVGFMVFVCAVAVMIIVRAPFTSMQKSMLIFWAILMHLQSAKSIIEVFLTLVGGLFMVWYTFGKKQPPNDVMM